MFSPQRLLFRPNMVLLASALIFAAAVWLRVEAYDLCTHGIHVANTPGTEINAAYTDVHKFDALVDVARVGLALGAVVHATAVAAKLFLPANYPPVVDLGQKNF